jgi:hypothetical protein
MSARAPQKAEGDQEGNGLDILERLKDNQEIKADAKERRRIPHCR